MHRSSPEAAADVIETIYEAACDRSSWPNAVQQLRRLFDGSQACIARSGPSLQPHDCVTTRDDPSFAHSYIADYCYGPNPVVEFYNGAAVGHVYSDHAAVGHESLRRSRFWNEWMAPQDMYGGLTCKLMVSGPSSWFVDIQRGRGQEPFDAAEATLLRRLVPHLRRAVRIGCEFEMAQGFASAFMHLSVGVVVADADQRLISMNPAAEDILAPRGSALQIRNGRLVAADAGGGVALSRMLADVCGLGDDGLRGAGGDLILRARRGREASDLLASVSPLPQEGERSFAMAPRAILFIREMTLALPERFADLLRELHGFSPKEAKLAASLAAGRTLKEAAADEGIAFSTARSYLEEIFRKTGTRQQSHLVATLRSAQPLRRM